MNKTEYIAHEIFKFYGCNCSSKCPKAKSEDNLYLIGLNYSSHYEDDDCSFSYLNAETGEVVHDTWTTRFACPCFSSYLRMTVPTAHEAGYISDEVYNNFVNARWEKYLESVVHDLTNLSHYIPDFPVVNMIGRELNIPVVVDRGRKYRGTGTLLQLVPEQDGPWVYRNRGYHIVAKVLGEDNLIHFINPAYLDTTEATKAITCQLTSILETNPDDSIALTGVYPFNTVNTEDILDEKQVKYNTFKESKMPGLIEWCREKAPEKTEEEIKEWAEHIFARKYPAK